MILSQCAFWLNVAISITSMKSKGKLVLWYYAFNGVQSNSNFCQNVIDSLSRSIGLSQCESALDNSLGFEAVSGIFSIEFQEYGITSNFGKRKVFVVWYATNTDRPKKEKVRRNSREIQKRKFLFFFFLSFVSFIHMVWETWNWIPLNRQIQLTSHFPYEAIKEWY